MKDKKKTKYRTIHNGYQERLEYKKGLCWHYVPSPHYDTVFGREHCDGYWKGGWTANFELFMEWWPNIEDYFKKDYNPKQEKLENKAAEYWAKIKKNKGKIVYLN